MTRRRLRDCVIVIGLGKVRARTFEPVQTTVQLRPPALDVITTHLIDRDENDERGFNSRLSGHGCRERQGARGGIPLAKPKSEDGAGSYD